MEARSRSTVEGSKEKNPEHTEDSESKRSVAPKKGVPKCGMSCRQ